MQQSQQNNASPGQPVDAATALHRKAQVGSAEYQARAMSLAKALRLSLAKVADDLCDMAMAMIGARRELCKVDVLPALMEGNKLLILLDGPLRQRGAAILDPVVVGGLIQQQTMGTVQPAQPGEERKPTATDAAICAPILDAWLARAAELPDDPNERQLIKGYAFGARCEESRLLMLAMEEPEYEVLRLTLDMAGGVRQGEVILCLPTSTSLQAEIEAAEARAGEDHSQPPPPAAMEKIVMGLRIDLNVGIARLKLPLSDVQGLQVDDVLDLNVSSFEQASVQTPEGRKLSSGTLGQLDGLRAVQLEHAPPSITSPMRRAADRETLDLPRVSGDGTGTQGRDPLPEAMQLPLMDQPGGDLPSMAQMPEMAEMPQSAGIPDLPPLEGLPDLPDLPDMSDLPGFGDGEELPDLSKL